MKQMNFGMLPLINPILFSQLLWEKAPLALLLPLLFLLRLDLS